MSTEAKGEDVNDIEEEVIINDDEEEKETPKKAQKRKLRQSTIDETLLGRAAPPVAKKPTKAPSITVKKTVISKEDMDRLVAEKKPQGYGPVVAEASSCSNDEVRKMHQTLVSVNANRPPTARKSAERESPVKTSPVKKENRQATQSILGWLRQSPQERTSREPHVKIDIEDEDDAVIEEKQSADCSPKKAESEEQDDSDETLSAMGTCITSLLRTPQCSAKLSDLKASEAHVVLVQVNSIGKGSPPRPFPSTTGDATYGWLNGRNVRMPCSSENKYPSPDGNDVVDRWPLVQAALVGADSWKSSQDIEKAIISYNHRYKKSWSFDVLHHFFDSHLEKSTAERCIKTVVPAIARLALRLPELITQPLPLLRQGKSSSVTLSQEQAACLLANAFFCTFPSRNRGGSNLPCINFNSLYYKRGSNRSVQKLQCIFHYFDRVSTSMPIGLLTFQRRSRDVFPDWAGSKKLLPRLYIDANGTIEDDGVGMLQADFANKYIGGGVLGHGCVQEEIRFLICPELIVGCLLAEAMKDNECLVMKGVERFSNYSGYAGSFQWTSNHVDATPRDSWMRRETEVVGIDAVPFYRIAIQYTPHSVLRELNKAFVGFYGDGRPAEHLSAIATGNWGCGAFGGDKELKSLLQLMAAAEAERDVAYFTFGDGTFMQELHRVRSELTAAKCDVGRLFQLIRRYADEEVRQTAGGPSLTVFEYVSQQLDEGNGE